jgi:arylsulfatase A-like enzyme
MRQPNVIIMLMDNLGYGDLGCHGSQLHRTPNVDALAREGARFTSFYSTSGVCTPSRASLMTGCYPRRVDLHCSGRGQCVLMPVEPKGLNPAEITLARLLKGLGYATGCVGKWHLGDQPAFLPTRHGFDEFFGIPYSEDMVPGPSPARQGWPPLPLMRGERVVEAPPDRDCLTQRYTEEGLRFIRAHRERPFFLYLAHAMPGSSDFSFASPAFRGRSANQLYGDAVEELDWSTGEVLRALGELGLERDTLVVWTSDNGAVQHDPPQGSNAPLRGWGYDTSEGGQRVPCIMRLPGVVAPGLVTDEVATMMDLLPTVGRLARGAPPADRAIDGHDIGPLLRGEAGARSAYDARGFFYYFREQLQAVRSGPWKLYLPLARKMTALSGDLTRAVAVPAALYDLRRDIGETRECASEHPEVVRALLALAEDARRDLGDLGRPGSGQRAAGWVERPTARVIE